jgi:RNA 2',3'-cyclic 3'-phosphodiesterase
VRLFVAAYPPAAALDDLAERIADLHVGRAAAAGVNSRLSARSLWHVTLAFLGDVDDSRCDDVAAALTSGADAFEHAPPTLRLAGGGTFGRGRFTTLWVGLGGAVDELKTLAGTVRAELRRARISYDHKPFRAHMTLARPGTRLTQTEIDDDVASLCTYSGPEWPLLELALVQSHLGPKPTHDILHTAPLGTHR